MDTRDKVLNACFRLNAEAYEAQVLARNGRKLKQFTPCPKAEALMAVIRKGEHFGTSHMLTTLTHCTCHSGLTDARLMDYEYDDTYRLANYAHDGHTLYPKLYA